VGDVLRLVRAPNLVLAAAGVLAGGWIALGALAVPPLLGWAALSSVGLGAAGNVWNDVQDAPVDRINHPHGGRPIAAGRISRDTANLVMWLGGLLGVGGAALVGGSQVVAALLVLALMFAYSPWLKRLGPTGNLTVALVAGFPLAFGAMAVGGFGAGMVPWMLAAWIHFGRELVKDLADEAGDRTVGRRTLPVRVGRETARRIAMWTCIAFVPVSVLLPLAGGYGTAYFAIAALAQVLVLLAALRLQQDRFTTASRSLKAAMAVGLAALVIGRITAWPS